jgi:GT2 family glycosyltransferase
MDATGVKPVIEVIIVNFNTGDALTRCVQSVLAQQLPISMTIVDNASSDDSVGRLQKTIGRLDNLNVIANDENMGFAKAVNAAAKDLELDGQRLLILNPDCEMLTGSLAALSQALDDDPGAALAGPVLVGRDGRPLRGTLRRFPDPWNSLLTISGLWRLGRWIPAFKGIEMSEQLPAGTVPAEAVSGACMMLSQSVFLEMGCMDGAYGLHCEDLDLMYRLRQRGFHCLIVPSALVFHQQGISSSSRPLWVHWQKHRGMQRFFLKFQADKTVFPMRWLVIAGIWLRFCVTLPLVWFRS